MLITRNFILGGLVLCLLGCSNQKAQTSISNSHETAGSNEANLLKSDQTPQSPVKVVGYFTNVESNGEHQWGYSVSIWRQDDRIYGLVSGDSSPMLVGDPPTGLLVDPVFDEKSGKFSFRAKLPSYTYYFDGVLTDKVLKGRLLNTRTDNSKKLVLKRSKELSSEMMNEFANYEDWKQFVDRILKFRGPKA